MNRSIGHTVEDVEPGAAPPAREPFRSAGALVSHRVLGRFSIIAPELLRRVDAATLGRLAEAIASEVDTCLALRSPPIPRRPHRPRK